MAFGFTWPITRSMAQRRLTSRLMPPNNAGLLACDEAVARIWHVVAACQRRIKIASAGHSKNASRTGFGTR